MSEKLHISRANSKLGYIPSVNLTPFPTCRPDAPCARLCYARKGRFLFKNVKNTLEKNWDLWCEDPDSYEKQVVAAAIVSKFFRWHSAGDIPSADYLSMMVRVAKACPTTSFLCFTKQYEIVDEWVSKNGMVPENLHIVYSHWGDVLVPANPYHFPSAHIRFKKESCSIPEGAHQCPGYCGDCVATGCSCWDLKRGESVVFNQH